ncbi:twin-arginine translocation signal domain-containing protein, partial [bacterium]
LLTLLAFLAGSYVLQHKNRLVWIGLVVICALGFFTVPIMLYAFGGLMAWLLVSALAGDLRQEYPSRRDFLRWWAVAGAAVALLTLLLYTPVLVVSGPSALFANQFVSGLPWDQFLTRMQAGWHLTWSDWMVGVPPALQILLAAGVIAGLALHRRISRFQIPTQLPMLAWIALVLLVQRSDTLSKLWVFLDTLFLIWAAGGLAALAGRIRLPARLRVSAPGLAAGLALAVLCLFPLRESFSQPAPLALDQSDTRITMEHLAQVIRPGDMIVVDIPVDAKIQYYAMVAGIPQTYFYLPKQGERPFERAFLVVAPSFNQTPTSVLEQRMLEPATFDLAGSHLESDFGVYRVYRVLPAAMDQ